MSIESELTAFDAGIRNAMKDIDALTGHVRDTSPAIAQHRFSKAMTLSSAKWLVDYGRQGSTQTR